MGENRNLILAIVLSIFILLTFELYSSWKNPVQPVDPEQAQSQTGAPTAPTPTPVPMTEFVFTPPPHYHVSEGALLTFTVTATFGGSPVPVTVSGLPATASFDGTNFSWVGEFEDTVDTGRHDMTFSAAGETVDVTIGTTESALVSFDMFLTPTTLLWGEGGER